MAQQGLWPGSEHLKAKAAGLGCSFGHVIKFMQQMPQVISFPPQDDVHHYQYVCFFSLLLFLLLNNYLLLLDYV